MRQRRQHPQQSGVANEGVELAPALEQARPQTIEGVEIGQIAGNKRRRAAQGADLVVEFLERALCAGQRDDM